MLVSGGVVTGGAYEFSASGIGASHTIVAGLTFTGVGRMGGDATTPVIEPTSMSRVGTAVTQGLEVAGRPWRRRRRVRCEHRRLVTAGSVPTESKRWFVAALDETSRTIAASESVAIGP